MRTTRVLRARAKPYTEAPNRACWGCRPLNDDSGTQCGAGDAAVARAVCAGIDRAECGSARRCEQRQTGPQDTGDTRPARDRHLRYGEHRRAAILLYPPGHRLPVGAARSVAPPLRGLLRSGDPVRRQWLLSASCRRPGSRELPPWRVPDQALGAGHGPRASGHRSHLALGRFRPSPARTSAGGSWIMSPPIARTGTAL